MEALSDTCAALLTGKPRVSKRPAAAEWDQQMANQMEADMRKALGADLNDNDTDSDSNPPSPSPADAAAAAQAAAPPGVRIVHRRKYTPYPYNINRLLVLF